MKSAGMNSPPGAFAAGSGVEESPVCFAGPVAGSAAERASAPASPESASAPASGATASLATEAAAATLAARAANVALLPVLELVVEDILSAGAGESLM